MKTMNEFRKVGRYKINIIFVKRLKKITNPPTQLHVSIKFQAQGFYAYTHRYITESLAERNKAFI